MRQQLLRCLLLMMSSVAMRQSNRTRTNKPRLRVVQGWSAHENDYPFVVTLMRQYGKVQNPVFFRACTGSLVSSQFVITAAHCIKPQIRYVRCGNMSAAFEDSSTCKSEILKQFAHPGHRQNKNNNDIGLVKIEPLVMKHYGRLQAVDYKTLLGRAVRYAGYGQMAMSDSLKKIKDREKRPLQIGEGVIYATNIGFDPMLMVAPKCFNRDQHPYRGDSGGPLLIGGRITGVACFVRIGGQKKHHPVLFGYIPVSTYLDWIRLTMNTYGNN